MSLIHIQQHEVEIRHFHLFCGLGGGAMGFNAGEARVGSLSAKFRCVGGVDIDEGAIKDFSTLVGVKGTVLDLFSKQQYEAFHGREPPSDWNEAGIPDIQRAAGWERPHIIFLSAPCKGFSGLMSSQKSATDKYQALNELTLRGVWLALEAYKDDPVELYVFENVPRITVRGRHLLDQITDLFRFYGYAVAETTHDCGELGGLAQSRRRFLLVARHQSKVPPYLYEPHKKPLRSVGEILSRLPLAGDVEAAGPMHRIPSLHWKTWVRLAFVEAGSDWRCLNQLRVENGVLKDFYLTCGVNKGLAGRLNIADPGFRVSQKWESGQAFGVRGWGDSSGAITCQRSPGQGVFSVADPRTGYSNNTHTNIYRVIKFNESCKTITGASHVTGGSGCVADPRGNGSAVQYQVTGLSSAAPIDFGGYGGETLPAANDKLVAYIQALDGTHHRPFTTLELAALQGLFCPDTDTVPRLSGSTDSDWRERIGNAVPPPAAQSIASIMGETLLLAWSGQTFTLSNNNVWVRSGKAGDHHMGMRQVAIALSVDGLT